VIKCLPIVDYTDRTTCIIFGDGAGCVLLEPVTEDVGVMDWMLKSDGNGEAYLHMKAGGSRMPASHESVDTHQHYVYQEGAAVYKFAVTNMADISAQASRKK
jgi:3-oxoacyl-[acyl-carrier-protein] synthase III